MKSYIQLFKNFPIIKKLSTVQLIAYFGTWFSNVAIYTLLIKLGASPFMISLVVAMHFIPTIIQAPFSGVIVDKLNPKKLMATLLIVEMCMTLLFLTVTSLEHIWYLVFFIFIRMSASSVFFAALMTLLPKLISGKNLQKANEVHSIIWSLTFTAGMAVGGVIVHFVGIYTAFVIDAMLFLIAFFIFIKIEFEVEIKKEKEKLYKMFKDGLVYIKNNKDILHLMLLHSIVGVTVFDTLVTLLADYYYKYIISIPLAIGLTNASRALALMIGPLFLSNWINHQRLLYLLIFQGICIIFWGMIQKDFYVGLFGMFLIGLSTTTIWSYTYALLQESIDKKYLGRIIAYNDMMFMIVTVITTFFIGISVSYIGLDIISYILGSMFLLSAIYYKGIVWKILIKK
ncbi:MFS transporter [Arcobacter sp. FWKO B]|uniref:MFS transporter n=1 Tax=Arcobacter sp. FWKO B TaxID=2593672 RepID=UPI0018A41A8C|nr:MFS transporter [Arcobacter sp. FWKO B]QOG12942.1 MFS transporter [Arcobacter sp. FWKO B]